MYQPPSLSQSNCVELYKESISNKESFWKKMAETHIDWFQPFQKTFHGSFEQGNIAWFLQGKLNVSFNCLDRHCFINPNKIAMIWEADQPDSGATFTYSQVLEHVCKLANALKSQGVRKGDRIAIYMPMIPQAAFAMLACARIGAIHSVVFAGFSADALSDRINNAKCKLLLVADCGYRGGKVIPLKTIADEALESCPSIESVFVYCRSGSNTADMKQGRDVWWEDIVRDEMSYCSCEAMDSEDPLFMLYTRLFKSFKFYKSGSTGKPKGVVHSQAGYLLGAMLSTKYVFDIHPDSIHGCMADVGWITGHTYIVYGPLALGSTTVIFESIPTFPTPSRYWQTIEKHKITSFYTAPTAIRALKKLGDHHITSDLSSLRVIGSVGEPIDPVAWLWFYEKIGKSKCALVDTYWQTETGSIVISPIPMFTPTKPGSSAFPFFGVELAILDPHTGEELIGNGVEGILVIKDPIPSIARTIYNNHSRFVDTYLKPYPGFYFTGDGATRDSDGYYWVSGRVDDVINVSGHRLSTIEIESALIQEVSCAESAVVGVSDDITGQAIVFFCVLKPGYENEDESATKLRLRNQVRHVIGSFATPKYVHVVCDLPKTRSGKIMRRLLRKIANGEVNSADLIDGCFEKKLGDLSTLADPLVIGRIIKKILLID